MVMWNGAMDYSKGIFHEPFFYGQAYNYMLEALFAVPLIWMDVPVYMALPISTSFLALIPFVVLALIFMKKENFFWVYLGLAFPVFLPLEYNFLTTISRGLVQANLFIPFLFIPLFYPQKKRSVTILFIFSALSFIANQSSLVLIVPILIVVYSYHFKSRTFYVKALLVIPFLLVDYLAKYFYKLHPERVLHSMSGLELDGETLLTSISTINHFEYLLPFFSNLGIIYPIIFIVLAIYAFVKSMKKEFMFIISIPILLLITLSIPKVQTLYIDGGLFFTPSRLYLYLPILLLISTYFVFRKTVTKKYPAYILLVLCSISLGMKYIHIQKIVDKTVMETDFPIAKNQDLILQSKNLRTITTENNIDLIIHSNSTGWNYIFDSYAFNPLNQGNKNTETISINLNGDRRSWLYQDSQNCKNILLNGVKVDNAVLNTINYERLNQNQIIIYNDTMTVGELFTYLNLKFGNTQP